MGDCNNRVEGYTARRLGSRYALLTVRAEDDLAVEVSMLAYVCLSIFQTLKDF